LIEYKHEAYTMFEDLMHDIHSTFAERFLRAQIVFSAPRPAGAPGGPPGSGQQGGPGTAGKPRKRYNALGILEDITDEESAPASGNGEVDIGPSEPPSSQPVARPEPTVVAGGGRARPLVAGGTAAVADWSSVGRNDPCPCGSGKKFKKCHGAGASRP
jgi:preprotein translocase subunit SecA